MPKCYTALRKGFPQRLTALAVRGRWIDLCILCGAIVRTRPMNSPRKLLRLGVLQLALLPLGFAQQVSFRITPLRPIEQLRAEALKEQPPREAGTFLKPDLVE